MITLRRSILSGSCLMAAGPGPGSHWVSINIVIGKQQDTGATARPEEAVHPIRRPGEISRTNQRPGMACDGTG